MFSLLNFLRNSNHKDTGLRGTSEGRLYVDKFVFYNRPEVRLALENLKKSPVIAEHINNNRM